MAGVRRYSDSLLPAQGGRCEALPSESARPPITAVSSPCGSGADGKQARTAADLVASGRYFRPDAEGSDVPRSTPPQRLKP